MVKKLFIILGIALAVILVLCWIYLPCFSRYHELKQEEEKLTKRIQEIDGQIKTLADEKYLLQNDVAYLEKVIREELGFVKPGEIIYEMITRKNPGNTSSNQTLAADNADSTPSVSSIQPQTSTQSVKNSETSPPKIATVRSPSSKTTSSRKRSR